MKQFDFFSDYRLKIVYYDEEPLVFHVSDMERRLEQPFVSTSMFGVAITSFLPLNYCSSIIINHPTTISRRTQQIFVIAWVNQEITYRDEKFMMYLKDVANHIAMASKSGVENVSPHYLIVRAITDCKVV